MALFRRHDHGSMSLDTMMDNMSDDDEMSAGTITVEHFPVVYWEIVGAVIAAFFVRNVVEMLICRQRLAAARANKPDPARPRNVFARAYATLAAIAREASNASIPPIAIGPYTLRPPPLGNVSLVLAHFILVIVLCLYKFDTTDFDVFEQLAYRAAFVSLAQFPLLFLLAGKNNLIGFVTGYSYERLNWLHRWIARCLLVSVTIHMGWWFTLWAPYSGYTQAQLTTDATTMTGFAAWCILLWIVLSSFAPIRGWNYELFVLQHIISMIGFTTMVFIHTPSSDWSCLWAAVAVYFTDRLGRAIWMVYTNLSIFNARNMSKPAHSGTWACNAEMRPLPNGMTRMTIRDPPIRWRAGQHALVSCNTVVPLQSHPFTISSLPADRKMEFLVKSHAGATKRLHMHAKKMLGLPVHSNEGPKTVPVLIQGPFGRMRPLRQFDSVVFIAGSTGATFTTPLLRDLVTHMANESKGGLLRCAPGAVTRHIRYVWVVKSRQQLSWFTAEINQAVADVERLKDAGKDVTIDMSIYITCDPTFTDESDLSKLPQVDTDNGFGIGTANIEMKKETTLPSIGVEEIDPRSVDTERKQVKTCGVDGTCCCQTTITDEQGEDAVAEAVVCNCASHGTDSSSVESASATPLDETSSSEKERPLTSLEPTKDVAVRISSAPSPTRLHPSIALLSGRPHPRTIIQTCLQQAHGESAVVACGPRGLNDRVREDVVFLSDDRAVHKGSGAQGIWFWSEGFGW